VSSEAVSLPEPRPTAPNQGRQTRQQFHRCLHVETVNLGSERSFALGLKPRVRVLAARGAVFIKLGEGAVLHSRLGAGFKGRLWRWFVRALFGRQYVEQPVLPEPSDHTVAYGCVQRRAQPAGP